VAAPNRLGLSARTGCVGSAGALRVVIEALVDTGAIRDIRQRLRATAQSQDERDRRNNIRVAQPREKSVQHQALQSRSACTPLARVADRRVFPTRRTFWGEAGQRAVVQSRVLEQASIDDATVFRTARSRRSFARSDQIDRGDLPASDGEPYDGAQPRLPPG
jgi:hypothetical protein